MPETMVAAEGLTSEGVVYRAMVRQARKSFASPSCCKMLIYGLWIGRKIAVLWRVTSNLHRYEKEKIKQNLRKRCLPKICWRTYDGRVKRENLLSARSRSPFASFNSLHFNWKVDNVSLPRHERIVAKLIHSPGQNLLYYWDPRPTSVKIFLERKL